MPGKKLSVIYEFGSLKSDYVYYLQSVRIDQIPEFLDSNCILES